jgi:predicted nuclease of predicted toxin-antitoxin system
MKLLLDQGIPHSAAAHLSAAGIDAVQLGELNLSAADNSVILQWGRDSECAVVTLDADFHTLLALSGAKSPSVIRIRIESLRGAETARLLETVIVQCGADLSKGAAVTVQEGRIRIRQLPILENSQPIGENNEGL